VGERGRAWTFLELVRICCGGFAEDRAEDKILCLALSSSLSTVPISRLLSSSLQFDQTKKSNRQNLDKKCTSSIVRLWWELE
jgi:hypothetical protein